MSVNILNSKSNTSPDVFKARLDGALYNLTKGGVPAHGRGLGMRWSLRYLPTQKSL